MSNIMYEQRTVKTEIYNEEDIKKHEIEVKRLREDNWWIHHMYDEIDIDNEKIIRKTILERYIIKDKKTIYKREPSLFSHCSILTSKMSGKL